MKSATAFSGTMLPISQFPNKPAPYVDRRLCVRNQDVTLISRYGIEDIGAPTAMLAPSLKRGVANCDLQSVGDHPPQAGLPERLDHLEV
jgi:hypothetical protein